MTTPSEPTPDLSSRVRHVAVTLDLEHAPDVPWPWEADAGPLVPSEILLGYTRWPRGGRITVTARVTGYLRGSDRTRLTDRLDIDLDRLPDGLPGWVQELADENMPVAFGGAPPEWADAREAAIREGAAAIKGYVDNAKIRFPGRSDGCIGAMAARELLLGLIAEGGR